MIMNKLEHVPSVQMVAPANRESLQMDMLVECLIICDDVIRKLKDCGEAHERYVKENGIDSK